ncbi:citrate-proton symporter, partial [Pseudomonas syringae]
MSYGVYATAIARAFFPSDSAFASLMLSLATFGAGFLMRPLGAICLGAHIDRHGRRKGLIITLAMMAMGTLLLACVPRSAPLGVIAPLLVLPGPLLPGSLADVELVGASAYLLVISPPDREDDYVSRRSARHSDA